MDKKVDLIGKLLVTYAFILALSFLIYTFVVLPEPGAEKVNAIVGLLGWSATIYAPIAALFLLDQWKSQTHYNAQLELLSLMYVELNDLTLKIIEYREGNPLASFLISNYMHKKMNRDVDQSDTFEFPSFGEIRKSLENIRSLLLRLYIYDTDTDSSVFNTGNQWNSFVCLEKYLESLESCSYLSKHKPLEYNDIKDPSVALEKYYAAFYCSSSFYNFVQSEGVVVTENPYCKKLNQYLKGFENDIRSVRKALNS